MMNIKKLATSVAASSAFFVALATPTFAAPAERVDGFVCPVITTDAVMHSPNGGEIFDGDYTILGPDVSVPVHATNGDGTDTPDGPHSASGDTDYTAIWSN